MKHQVIVAHPASQDRAGHEPSQSSLSRPSGDHPIAQDFTIAAVLAWARTKPARERYCYTSLDNCALAQFSRHVGLYLHGDERHRLEASKIGMAACCNGTFGGFARELERIVEPSLRKRLWARLTGKTIGQATVSSTWTKADAYMAAEQVSA